MLNASTILPPSRFPTSSELKDAMEIAGSSVEAAEYLAQRVNELAENSKVLKKSPDLKQNVLSAVTRFVDYVKFKFLTKEQPWAGQSVETSHMKNMQQNLAEEALNDLDEELTEVRMDYAVSEAGHYVRGYSSENGALEPEAVSAVDKLFNAWLASKNYLIKGGYLYPADSTAQEVSNRLNAETVKNLLADGTLNEYMEQQGIDLDMHTREYPGEQKEAEAKQQVQAAVERAEQAASAEPSVQEETPQTGMGAH